MSVRWYSTNAGLTIICRRWFKRCGVITYNKKNKNKVDEKGVLLIVREDVSKKIVDPEGVSYLLQQAG